jgi:hypothetical protein
MKYVITEHSMTKYIASVVFYHKYKIGVCVFIYQFTTCLFSSQVESVVGTDALKKRIDDTSARLDQSLTQQNEANVEFGNAVTKKNKLLPQLLKVVTLFDDADILYSEWIDQLVQIKKSQQETIITQTERKKKEESNVDHLTQERRIQDQQQVRGKEKLEHLQRRISAIQQLKRQTERQLRKCLEGHSKQKLVLADGTEKKKSLEKMIINQKKKVGNFIQNMNHFPDPLVHCSNTSYMI